MILTLEREKKLKRNPKLLFWINAFMHLNFINIVVVLFYLHRGLTIPQIFYLSIVWAVVNLLAEIPSSYMADKWGRKKTLLLGVFLLIIHNVIYIFADGIGLFVVSFIFLSCSFACFSGTDEALLFDTNRELGKSDNSLKLLGNYSSAIQIFKIITPIIGVFIARNLVELQFLTLILFDLFGAFVSFFLVMKLTEAHHYVDIEKREIGILYDARKFIFQNPKIIRMILNKTLFFIAAFILWRYHQKLFTDFGLTVIVLGIGWSIENFFLFVGKRYITKLIGKYNIDSCINFLNRLFIILIFLFFGTFYFIPNAYILFSLFLIMMFLENIRWPLFSELFNRESFSYNRATTLSLSNFLKSILDVPLLLLGSFLVSLNPLYPFGLSFCIGLLTIMFFALGRLSTNKSK